MMGIRKRTSQVAVFIACLALAAGCSEDDGFIEPPSPASLTIVAGTPQTGTVGIPLGQTLRVRVTDDDGAPLGGVPVTWAVTAGGGTLANATSTTDGDGIAVNSWTLGNTEGQQTVTASIEGATAVTFTATAGPRTALLLQRTAGNAQVSLPGERLTPIRVRLLDSNGLPLPGVVVTWEVLTGGGSVSPATSTTNALGEAATLWTLGGQGVQTLRASAPGAGSIIFTATAADPCIGARDFAALTGAGRSLGPPDCLLTSGPRSGSFIEYFTFAPTAATAATFTMTSAALDPYLVLLRGADTVAFNDNASAATTSATIRVFLAPGSYRFGATSAVAGQTGAYTAAQTAMPAVTNCENDGRFFITPGVTLTQTLSATDCLGPAESGNGQANFDRYRIYLRSGQAITITYAAAAPVDAVITVTSPTGASVTRDNFFPGGTETLTYTAAVTGFFTLDARTYRETVDEFGPYTLTISAATPP